MDNQLKTKTKTTYGGMVSTVLLTLVRTLYKLALTMAFVSLIIWWLVPVATGGLVVLGWWQAAGITGLVYLFKATTIRVK